MCGCDCCVSGDPTCYDPAQRGSRKWLCRCNCGNCIARVLDAHESWAREDERAQAGNRVAALFAGDWMGTPAWLVAVKNLRHYCAAAAADDRSAIEALGGKR